MGTDGLGTGLDQWTLRINVYEPNVYEIERFSIECRKLESK